MGPGPCLNLVTVCISASLDEQTSADLFNRGRPKYSRTCHGTAELLCIAIKSWAILDDLAVPRAFTSLARRAGIGFLFWSCPTDGCTVEIIGW